MTSLLRQHLKFDRLPPVMPGSLEFRRVQVGYRTNGVNR
jgi:hypothetical protein